MPKGSPIDGVGASISLIGGVLIYAGIKGYSVLAVLGNLVTGKPITTDVSVTVPLQGRGDAPTDAAGFMGPTLSENAKVMGQQMAAARGWTGTEWTALDKLFTKESSWNRHADNPSSHAYGIPQALPYTKMPKAAWPESKGGKSDAQAQIQWGLDYIAGRYGTPSMAWAFHLKNDWY
jgi:resuscitation-promoting factor RpfB